MQDKLWSGLKELADGIMSATTAVWHMQRVVAKKKVCRCLSKNYIYLNCSYLMSECHHFSVAHAEGGGKEEGVLVLV
mgnify:CR=1 FL=1